MKKCALMGHMEISKILLNGIRWKTKIKRNSSFFRKFTLFKKWVCPYLFQYSIFIFFFLFSLPIAATAQDRGIEVKPTGDVERKLALIVGNAHYKEGSLRNPINDAQAIADVLTKLGFEVDLLLNADRKKMHRAIRSFGDRLKKGGVGLFFYAGHGMQTEGRNYLIPIGADIQREDEIIDEAVDAGYVLRKMESAGNRLNIVFLDACRNNPFARSFRSLQSGLAQMDAPKGSLIVYATAPGTTAADGEGINGIFTKHLLRYITTPNLEIGQMLRKVRADVIEETNEAQVPWDSSSLTGDFYFRGQNMAVASLTPMPLPNIDVTLPKLGLFRDEVDQPPDTIAIELSNPVEGFIEINKKIYYFQDRPTVYLTKGRHPFKLRVPEFKKTIYGVFEVLLVNDETSAATFGVEDSIKIFGDEQIAAAMKGRPVRFSLAYQGEKGKSVPVRYILSLRKVK